MNFIKDILQGVDNIWSILTIPLLLIVGMYLIMFLPIPTAIAMWFFIGGQFAKADYMQRVADIDNDPKFIRLKNTCVFNGIILLLATIIAYGFYIYLIINSNELCKDYSDYIPGTLPALLQKIVPYSC